VLLFDKYSPTTLKTKIALKLIFALPVFQSTPHIYSYVYFNVIMVKFSVFNRGSGVKYLRLQIFEKKIGIGGGVPGPLYNIGVSSDLAGVW